MFFYEIGNLSIDSTICIPYLNKRDKPDTGRIKISLSTSSFDKKFEDKRTIFSKDCIFYKSKTGSVYKISKNEISICPASADSPNELSRILIGLPLGYLLKLNGLNVLHGCCVSKGNKAACIIGKSGAGKSTMALGLTNLGLDFVTEDLCVFQNKKILGFNPWVKSSEANFIKSSIKSTENIPIENDARERIFYNKIKIKNLRKQIIVVDDNDKDKEKDEIKVKSKIKIKITEKKNKKDDDDDDDLRAMSEGDSKDSNDGGDDDDDDDDDDVTTTAGADPTTTAAPTTTASPTTTTADNIGPIELGDSYVCTKNDNKYNCT